MTASQQPAFQLPAPVLLDWYCESARGLPWRETNDPYRIWISEIMLQQTQVKTVLPRYAVWFDRFPTIGSLAAASADDVLKQWEGLGYYRRARFIHRAACMIVEDYGGHFPVRFEDILSLPGIGRSTAGAIASFCFGASAPVLDGNVKRVLRRWHAIPDIGEKQLWQLAQSAIDQSGVPAAWNQAMMELGATVCSAGSPDCDACPVKTACLSAGKVAEVLPASKPVEVKDVHWLVHLHTCPARGIWLEQRPESGIWGGLWSPPISELDDCPDDEPLHIHQLTHRRLYLYANISDVDPKGPGCWVSSIKRYALPTGIHRFLEKSLP